MLAVVALGVAAAPPPASAIGPTFTVRGSAEQVDVTGLGAGAEVTLLDAGGTTVDTQTATPLGGALFRNVTPGTDYRVRTTADGTESDPVTVYSNAAAPWDPSVYSQSIASTGYQYLTTRDGTQLAINVHSPAGKGPFPTLIEYSGYGYADPAGPHSSISMIANLMGYSVVDVNMRGTGCSGGAFDYFETLQALDGYDVIETIARQPWVLHNKVGMFGISYGGISQLFTARVNPPSLAAITPLSVIDATPSTLYPGGILNTGFALSWAKDRVHDAEAAGPNTGQEWAYKQIQNGDTVCAANQSLHGAAIDLLNKIDANTHYDPAIADPIDPVSFVDQIHVPVFMACQWQDEQTGGHCPSLVAHMTGTDKKWFTFTNGAHIDALDPATLNHLFDFLELFVAQRAPTLDKTVIRSVAPLLYQQAMGVPGSDSINLPPDPIQDATTFDAALALFEQLPQVQVRFDNGAGTSPTGDTTPGNPYDGFTRGFDSLPVPGTQPATWFLGRDGALDPTPQAAGGIDTYTSDPSALPATNYDGGTGGGGLWGNASQWKWKWLPNPDGNAVSYLTPPLADDLTVVGKGAVYLWVKSSTPTVDLQATISEVRPDGNESFVQNGWIRTSERKLSTGTDNIFKEPSTLLAPIPSFTAADDAPMPADQFVEVAIPLYYQGHAYRAGSRIRVTIAAPGGSQPVWAFGKTEPSTGTASVSIAFTPSMPSKLVLPEVPGTIPTPLPACPTLRNEPCRPYQAIDNHTVDVAPPVPTTTVPTPTTAAPPTAAPTSTVPVPSTTTPTSTDSASSLPVTGSRLFWPAAIGVLLVAAGFVIRYRSGSRRPQRQA